MSGRVRLRGWRRACGGGIQGRANVVQTISHFSRPLPIENKGTMVVDFAKDSDEIKASLMPMLWYGVDPAIRISLPVPSPCALRGSRAHIHASSTPRGSRCALTA